VHRHTSISSRYAADRCGSVMEEMARNGLVRELSTTTYAPMVAGLRGITARHHDSFVRNSK
jgi:hypothetical protein